MKGRWERVLLSVVLALVVGAGGYAYISGSSGKLAGAPKLAEGQTNLFTSNASTAQSIAHPLVGKMAPALQLPAVGSGDKAVTLGAGKQTVVMFWTTW